MEQQEQLYQQILELSHKQDEILTKAVEQFSIALTCILLLLGIVYYHYHPFPGINNNGFGLYVILLSIPIVIFIPRGIKEAVKAWNIRKEIKKIFPTGC